MADVEKDVVIRVAVQQQQTKLRAPDTSAVKQALKSMADEIEDTTKQRLLSMFNQANTRLLPSPSLGAGDLNVKFKKTAEVTKEVATAQQRLASALGRGSKMFARSAQSAGIFGSGLGSLLSKLGPVGVVVGSIVTILESLELPKHNTQTNEYAESWWGFVRALSSANEEFIKLSSSVLSPREELAVIQRQLDQRPLLIGSKREFETSLSRSLNAPRNNRERIEEVELLKTRRQDMLQGISLVNRQLELQKQGIQTRREALRIQETELLNAGKLLRLEREREESAAASLGRLTTRQKATFRRISAKAEKEGVESLTRRDVSALERLNLPETQKTTQQARARFGREEFGDVGKALAPLQAGTDNALVNSKAAAEMHLSKVVERTGGLGAIAESMAKLDSELDKAVSANKDVILRAAGRLKALTESIATIDAELDGVRRQHIIDHSS